MTPAGPRVLLAIRLFFESLGRGLRLFGDRGEACEERRDLSDLELVFLLLSLLVEDTAPGVAGTEDDDLELRPDLSATDRLFFLSLVLEECTVPGVVADRSRDRRLLSLVFESLSLERFGLREDRGLFKDRAPGEGGVGLSPLLDTIVPEF